MERNDLETLLDAKLDPLYKAISKLEESQEKIVAILMHQARQDETIKHLREEIDRCNKTHESVFARIRAIETDSGNKTWETLKLVLTALGSVVLSLLTMRVIS